MSYPCRCCLVPCAYDDEDEELQLQQSLRPMQWPRPRPEHVRCRALRTIAGMVDGLRPGQELKVEAHRPEEQSDGRLFTVTVPVGES